MPDAQKRQRDRWLTMSLALNVLLGLALVFAIWSVTQMASTQNEAIELLIESRRNP